MTIKNLKGITVVLISGFAFTSPPKKDLLIVTKKNVKIVERKLNNRPVRKFNYSTPNQVLQ
jgi:hypothetical protein